MGLFRHKLRIEMALFLFQSASVFSMLDRNLFCISFFLLENFRLMILYMNMTHVPINEFEKEM